MDKTIIIEEIDSVMDTFCKDCFLKNQLTKDKGKASSHRFCIEGCTVGDQLKFLGSQLNKYTK